MRSVYPALRNELMESINGQRATINSGCYAYEIANCNFKYINKIERSVRHKNVCLLSVKDLALILSDNELIALVAACTNIYPYSKYIYFFELLIALINI